MRGRRGGEGVKEKRENKAKDTSDTVEKGQRWSNLSTLTGIEISVDLYIDMQVIFSLFEVIYNNYITQRIQFQF